MCSVGMGLHQSQNAKISIERNMTIPIHLMGNIHFLSIRCNKTVICLHKQIIDLLYYSGNINVINKTLYVN